MAVIVQNKRALAIRAAMLAKQKARRSHQFGSNDIKQLKADKRRQGKWAKKARRTSGLLDSSFVQSLKYTLPAGDVDVVLNGKKYKFFSVPEAIFNAWWQGAATCMTSDSGKVKRWWLGKTPSLGAFFNHYIKKKYSWVRM